MAKHCRRAAHCARFSCFEPQHHAMLQQCAHEEPGVVSRLHGPTWTSSVPPTTYVPVSLYSTTLNSTPCQSACILLRALSRAASLLAAVLTTCSLGSCSSRSNCSRYLMLKGAKPAAHNGSVCPWWIQKGGDATRRCTYYSQVTWQVEVLYPYC
jgi:hypothetical protein